MTLRQLAWATNARRSFEGDLIAWLIRCVPTAIWAPKELPKELNPFAERKPVSEAMRKHLESLAARCWRVMSGG